MEVLNRKMKAVEIRIPCKLGDFDSIVSLLTDEEREFMVKMEEKHFSIDTITTDAYYSHAFIDEVDLNKILTIYKQRGIEFILTDITEAYNNGESINLEFKLGLDEYIMSQTSVDDVLDKISKNGIDSLSRVDLMILKTQKADI